MNIQDFIVKYREAFVKLLLYPLHSDIVTALLLKSGKCQNAWLLVSERQ